MHSTHSLKNRTVLGPPLPGQYIAEAARVEWIRARHKHGPDAQLVCHLTWEQRTQLLDFLESFPSREACFEAMGWDDQDMRQVTFTGFRWPAIEGVIIELDAAESPLITGPSWGARAMASPAPGSQR